VIDLEYTQAMSTARLAFDRGQPEQAALLYAQALRRAEARDDAADIGDAAYDLALCLMRTRQYHRAQLLLTESRQELMRAGARTIDVRLMEAKLAYRTGDSATADRIAAEVANTAAATSAERCDALLLRGEVAMDHEDRQAATTFFTQARATLAKESGRRAAVRPALAAGVLGLEARLAGSDWSRAANLFDRQARLWQEAGLWEDMSESLLRAGRAFATGGNHHAAAQRLVRAARSRYAQGDIAGAAKAAEEARIQATQAGDSELIASLPLPTSRPAKDD
jgi:hypothetical protein